MSLLEALGTTDTYTFQSYERISIHLPTATALEKTAAWYCIDNLKNRYSGCTYSEVEEPVFVGKWLDKTNSPIPPGSRPLQTKEGMLYTDRISIFFVDVPKDNNNLRYAEEVADKFWAEANRCYGSLHTGQLSFWVYLTVVRIRERDTPEVTALKLAAHKRGLGQPLDK